MSDRIIIIIIKKLTFFSKVSQYIQPLDNYGFQGWLDRQYVIVAGVLRACLFFSLCSWAYILDFDIRYSACLVDIGLYSVSSIKLCLYIADVGERLYNASSF